LKKKEAITSYPQKVSFWFRTGLWKKNNYILELDLNLLERITWFKS